jgi:predicted permease
LRLIRGVLLESVWLSCGGLLLAVPLTAGLLAAARTYELPGRISVDWLAMSVDARVALLAAAVVITATLVIGLMAAGVGLGGQVVDVLRGRSGATMRLSRRRTRQALIVAQVAVTMVLLIGTGLFARSVAAALRLNSAFAPADVVVTSLNVRGFDYGPAETTRFFQQVRDEVAALPSIDQVALQTGNGGMGGGGTVTFNGEKRQVPSFLAYVHIDERYFSTIGMPIVAGRDFASTDTEGAELVAVVSESLGRFIANGGNPLGMTITESFRRLDRTEPDVVRIVGVVPDLITSVNRLEPLAVYYTMRQRPPSASQTLHMRSKLGAGAVATEIRNIVDRIDPRVAPSAVTTLQDQIARQMAPQQFGAAVLGALATVALLLTLLGTYVIAETMAKARERELGVRAALGATARHLGGLILTESIVLIGLGLVGGLGLTWLAASTVEALLYQTEPFDLTAIGLATVAILGLALLVSARPALRAARVDIAGLLRE